MEPPYLLHSDLNLENQSFIQTHNFKIKGKANSQIDNFQNCGRRYTPLPFSQNRTILVMAIDRLISDDFQESPKYDFPKRAESSLY